MSEPVEPPTPSEPNDSGAVDLASHDLGVDQSHVVDQNRTDAGASGEQGSTPTPESAPEVVASAPAVVSGIEREGPAVVRSSARGPSENTLRLTFTFLTVVAATTVLAWGTLMGPCNAHPPQSQKFKQASFEKLVARPQDAAIEFHHSLFIQDYERARKVASDAGLALVDKAELQCDPACKQQKLERVDRAVTRSILHRMKSGSAWVTVETFFDGQMVAESYEVKRIEQKWLVSRATPPPPPHPPPPPRRSLQRARVQRPVARLRPAVHPRPAARLRAAARLRPVARRPLAAHPLLAAPRAQVSRLPRVRPATPSSCRSSVQRDR
jgi:hypothetical protein